LGTPIALTGTIGYGITARKKSTTSVVDPDTGIPLPDRRHRPRREWYCNNRRKG
jgi:hypothetical protein